MFSKSKRACVDVASTRSTPDSDLHAVRRWIELKVPVARIEMKPFSEVRMRSSSAMNAS